MVNSRSMGSWPKFATRLRREASQCHPPHRAAVSWKNGVAGCHPGVYQIRCINKGPVVLLKSGDVSINLGESLLCHVSFKQFLPYQSW